MWFPHLRPAAKNYGRNDGIRSPPGFHNQALLAGVASAPRRETLSMVCSSMVNKAQIRRSIAMEKHTAPEAL